MSKSAKESTLNLSIYDRLDEVRMSERDRRLAKAHLRDAELIVDMVGRVVASFVRFVRLTAKKSGVRCAAHIGVR